MQLFLSHTWHPCCDGSDTHKRVDKVARELRALGWSTWFDQDNMGANIDASMSDGIERAAVVVVFLTKAYAQKLQSCAQNPCVRDNCYKEWTLAHALRRCVLPVVFETEMRDQSSWPSVLLMHLASALFVDGALCSSASTASKIHQWLVRAGYEPSHYTTVPKPLLTPATRVSRFRRASSYTAPIVKDVFPVARAIARNIALDTR